VADTPPLRAQYNANLPKLTQFWTELAQNEALYGKYKAIAARAISPAAGRAPPGDRQRAARLPPRRRRAGLRRRKERCAESASGSRSWRALRRERARRDQRLRTADRHDEAQLAGVPPTRCRCGREAAQADGKAG
jgi:oligopeptidase A